MQVAMLGTLEVRADGWEPEVSFEELVTMMVEADMRRVRDGGHGV